MRLILQKLGLNVNEQEQAVPSLSRLHLTSHKSADVASLVAEWAEMLVVVDGEEYIQGGNDVFRIEKEDSVWGVKELKRAVSAVSEKLPTLATISQQTPDTQEQGSGEGASDKEKSKTKEEEIKDLIVYTASSSFDQILDYDKVIKTVVPHDKALPSTKDMPFHHEAFYANLHHYHTNKLRNPAAAFGRYLIYGEVVTSTNTLLEKNASLLRNLPNGFTMTATTQIAGRGRGSNVWVAPPGAMMFSTVIHHSFALSQSAPVVFIQYLAALAIIQGIKGYAPGYEKIPVKLKWPNDIYAQLPGSANNPVVKIGGILVNSSYSGSTYDNNFAQSPCRQPEPASQGFHARETPRLDPGALRIAVHDVLSDRIQSLDGGRLLRLLVAYRSDCHAGVRGRRQGADQRYHEGLGFAAC
jgi:biotin--protein ligase